MIVFGSQLYGRTYRVPGAFHVSTRFIHVMFFPFVPRSSWLVAARERGGSAGDDVAYALPLQWRSVVLAWIRATLILSALATALVLCTQVLLDRSSEILTPTIVVLMTVSVAFWCSYRFDRPSAAQLADLLQSPGVPPELAALATATRGTT